jgi:hypothetical protein
MSTANLLVMNDGSNERAFFAFSHAMSHREALGAMFPLERFSVVPYLLDPMMLDNGMWRLNHQRAQDDMISTQPTWGLFPGTMPPYPGQLQTAVGDSKPLIDEQLRWLVFTNWIESFVASAAVSQVPPGNLFPAW